MDIMPLVKIGPLSALPPGSVMQAAVGEETFAICNSAGELHALDGICPHAGGPLGQGALHGTTLVCPWHAWEYDCVTGEHDRNPELKLQKFAVKVEGSDILIDIP